jgi:predicted PurR-regulated permease PerM
MNILYKPDIALEQRLSRRLLDVYIRTGLIIVLTMLCYRIFAPFLSLMAWGVILAVTLYPMHQNLARKMGNKQGLAATVIVIGGIVLIVFPTAVLMASLGDSIQGSLESLTSSTFKIPEPSPKVATWPIVGQKIFDFWSRAYADLPALIETAQPQIAELAQVALKAVASIAGAALMFLVSFIVAGIIMAFGESGAESTRAIFIRLFGIPHGDEFTVLSTATIRAVALGVLGVAFIQAIAVGLLLLIAKVPFTGALTLIVLVLGIAQVPALVVSLPVIGYIWASGNYSTGMAVTYTALLLVAGSLDNILKPLLLGRGVEAPMPVVLLGALGGLASAGILGMFVGATLLTLGYQLFFWWVASNPDVVVAEVVVAEPESKPLG